MRLLECVDESESNFDSQCCLKFVWDALDKATKHEWRAVLLQSLLLESVIRSVHQIVLVLGVFELSEIYLWQTFNLLSNLSNLTCNLDEELL